MPYITLYAVNTVDGNFSFPTETQAQTFIDVNEPNEWVIEPYQEYVYVDPNIDGLKLVIRDNVVYDRILNLRPLYGARLELELHQLSNMNINLNGVVTAWNKIIASLTSEEMITTQEVSDFNAFLESYNMNEHWYLNNDGTAIVFY